MGQFTVMLSLTDDGISQEQEVTFHVLPESVYDGRDSLISNDIVCLFGSAAISAALNS
jgi:hypothetical protein